MSEAEYAKVIAKNLRRIMIERDKTQADVARDLKISKATISSWMNGTRIPRMDKIDLLCSYFGVSRSEIMEAQDDANQYYTNARTARLAQEMFEDPTMRALYDMKRNMDPQKFQAHFDMMKRLYDLEKGIDDTGC